MSRLAPMNFAHKRDLVAAELARVEGREWEAAQLYEKAIAGADRHQFVQEEALALELAGRFYLARGMDRAARPHLEQARECYARWQAWAKVRRLEALLATPARAKATSAEAPAGSAQDLLDLACAMKAAQAISSEIELEKLAKALVAIAVESAGAQQGALVLEDSGRWLVRARKNYAEPGAPVLAEIPIDESDQVSAGIVRYVTRTREWVILGAARDRRFSRDLHLRKRRPKSVLCAPVVAGGRLLGVLYLENNLAADAFTADRVRVLELLASQAAISLENARYFEETKALNISLAQQIRERQRAEETLRASEEWFRELVQQAPEAILVHDAELGLFTDANARAERLFGRSLEELKRMGLQDLYESEQPAGRPIRESIREHIGRALAGGAPVFERLVRDARGRDVPCEVRLARLPFGNGKQIRSSFVDITERKRAEERMKRDARRKDEFLAMLGHELRNPLAPIQNASQILKLLGQPDPRAQRAREMIERQVAHLSRLVDDLLDVARIARGRLSLKREILDWAKLARTTAEDLRSEFEARGLVLELRLPQKPVFVSADPTRLVQVMSNVLNNAAKFSSRGGLVSVELEPGGGSGLAALKVQDAGIGMTRETREQLFSPFFQADTGLARSRGGMGMGLALAKGLVDLHGGAVEAASKGPGRGTCVTLRLPELEAPLEALAPQRPAPSASARSILVVEDNLDAARSLQLMLELMGHRVRVATDGPSGFALARSFRPEVVVCDIGLPGPMDGYAVARALRADPAVRGARLIALTGYGQDRDKALAREAGFDEHLTKPADAALILSSLG